MILLSHRTQIDLFLTYALSLLASSAALCYSSLLPIWLKLATCYKSHEHHLLYMILHRPHIPPNKFDTDTADISADTDKGSVLVQP